MAAALFKWDRAGESWLLRRAAQAWWVVALLPTPLPPVWVAPHKPPLPGGCSCHIWKGSWTRRSWRFLQDLTKGLSFFVCVSLTWCMLVMLEQVVSGHTCPMMCSVGYAHLQDRVSKDSWNNTQKVQGSRLSQVGASSSALLNTSIFTFHAHQFCRNECLN